MCKINRSLQIVDCEIFSSLTGIEFAYSKVDRISSSFDCTKQSFMIPYRRKDFRGITGGIVCTDGIVFRDFNRHNDQQLFLPVIFR
ncbi:hypothetical protein SDC9_99964 [bioreactor metagenome]|uniref:Uncharacterized protein n=1 Tax=bioreactor metagenome TaxID=1076179 RepID=A0A645AJ54_9ZZZZ